MLKRIVIETKLKAVNTCPVLSEHILQMHDSCKDIVGDQGAVDLLNSLMEHIIQNVEFDFFDEIESSICKKFKINANENDAVFNQLDLAGKSYITYSFMAIGASYLSEEMDKFIAISTAAKRLQGLLPTKDSALFGFMELINFGETFDWECDHTETYFNSLNQHLNALIDIKKRVPNTKMGRHLKIGVKSPKGNMNVRAWVEFLHLIWTTELGRTFEYDGEDGKNGRSRFIDFAYECLGPIHPAIEHKTIKNAVRSYCDKLKAGNELLNSNIIDQTLIA